MATSTIGIKGEASHEHRSLDSVRARVLTYEQEIKQYLDHLNANVEYYKFGVEKHGDGITIEVSVKATVRPKTSVSQIPA
jgi:hypothetical protein